MTKWSQARSASEVYLPPGHKLSCDPSQFCHPLPAVLKSVGLAEDAESAMFPHTLKMLDWGKRFNVHLRREQLKTPDVSNDPGTWKMLEQGDIPGMSKGGGALAVVVPLVVRQRAVA